MFSISTLHFEYIWKLEGTAKNVQKGSGEIKNRFKIELINKLVQIMQIMLHTYIKSMHIDMASGPTLGAKSLHVEQDVLNPIIKYYSERD